MEERDNFGSTILTYETRDLHSFNLSHEGYLSHTIITNKKNKTVILINHLEEGYIITTKRKIEAYMNSQLVPYMQDTQSRSIKYKETTEVVKVNGKEIQAQKITIQGAGTDQLSVCYIKLSSILSESEIKLLMLINPKRNSNLSIREELFFGHLMRHIKIPPNTIIAKISYTNLYAKKLIRVKILPYSEEYYKYFTIPKGYTRKQNIDQRYLPI